MHDRNKEENKMRNNINHLIAPILLFMAFTFFMFIVTNPVLNVRIVDYDACNDTINELNKEITQLKEKNTELSGRTDKCSLVLTMILFLWGVLLYALYWKKKVEDKTALLNYIRFNEKNKVVNAKEMVKAIEEVYS